MQGISRLKSQYTNVTAMCPCKRFWNVNTISFYQVVNNVNQMNLNTFQHTVYKLYWLRIRSYWENKKLVCYALLKDYIYVLCKGSC